MGGGLGIGPLEAMMQALDRVQTPLCAVAIVGRSARSEQRVLEYAHRVSYPVRVVRFVNNVHEYMHAADVLITKPGGLTSAEALVAQVPTVLFKPLPGQEERNTRYLVQRRAALRAKNTADLTRTVEALLLSDEKRAAMRDAMAQLGKPDAAAQIAAAIRALATERAEGKEIA
jgi:processive 1,2-diacylglycerol beta-glucosyltransferase